ncbi:hypothetical protein [Leptothermofonsia sp. ETS-13]|uniref:hypothetical protein n=1 Tax=Leptothermofonsia sp. ETS-13 TaxID=3035696 RepID=UPI003BA37B30
MFIFTLLIRRWLIRDFAGVIAAVISDLPTILTFLAVTLGLTAIAMIAWNIYIALKVKSLKSLAHLLDEVDRYNDVIQAVDVLDQLEEVGNTRVALNREQVLEALTIARKSLVCGLMTERILRQNRKLLARGYELFYQYRK